MQNVVNRQLPPCSLEIIREYLTIKGLSIEPESCTEKTEIWVDSENFNLVRLPITDDPMDFIWIVGVVEQLGKPIGDIPFYAKQIAHRFSPDV